MSVPNKTERPASTEPPPSPAPSRARRDSVVIGAAVAVAAIVVAGAAVQLTRGDDSGPDEAPADPSVGAAAPAQDPRTDLDLGGVSEQDVEDCLVPSYATSAADVDVLYGVRQRSATGSTPVLLLRNESGALRLCDVSGGDAPALLPLPTASESDPVVHLSTGRKTWECDGRTITGFSSTAWLAVTDEVTTVQERYVVDGEPGAWFSTSPHGGFAHLQTWLDDPVEGSSTVQVEHRVLDADGAVVGQSALPAGPQTLPGCTGGDAQIG